jgi:hypothetical protein
LIVEQGMMPVINITKQGQAQTNLQDAGKEPKYELCVQDIDELVGQVFATASANPTAFLAMGCFKQEAKKYLTEQNTVSSLTK